MVELLRPLLEKKEFQTRRNLAAYREQEKTLGKAENLRPERYQAWLENAP